MPWHRIVSPLAIAFAGVLAAANASAAPFGTAFTYQGELRDAGEAPTGAYDLRFRAYRAVDDAGVPLAELVVEDVPVVEGIFTTRVDFGEKFFVGDAIFVELSVRPSASADPNAFEALAPRQELTPAPYALKTAAGSVTDIELAPDAVAGTNVGDGSLSGADVGDNTLTSDDIQDDAVRSVDLALDTFDQTFWRVGGNAGVGTSVLGTTDNTRLALQSPVGVTINGPAVNSNTELTIRGNAVPAEGNADLSLWPRGGEAFFNFSTIGTTDADTRLAIHAVDTVPSFTGFATRLAMTYTGQLGIGNFATLTPLARVHSVRSGIGLDALDLPATYEAVFEDTDAQIALYSAAGANAGSAIGLAEIDAAGSFADQWGLVRQGVASGSALQLAYGTNNSVAANPALFHFGTNASLGVGAAPPNADTEVFVVGSGAAAAGDFSLRAQAGTSLFNFSVAGQAQADTALTLQFAGPSFNYEQRARFDNNGSVGFGRFADPGTFADSFVFADDSSATIFAPTDENQFLVRAAGGMALNGPPESASTELTINGIGGDGDLSLASGGNVRNYRIRAGGSTSANTTFFISYQDPTAVDTFNERFVLRPNGFVSLNPDTAAGYVLPAFPLTVGTDTSNGNGAHVTAGGTWTNGSSRLFKEAFTAIDVDDVLARVLAMPVTRWRYRGGEDAWHLGPVAEDFHAAFGLGGNERYIGTVDADGVALAAIQGLAQREDARVAALERENAALKRSVDALASRLEALERAGASR